jgi:hypothetical protein
MSGWLLHQFNGASEIEHGGKCHGHRLDGAQATGHGATRGFYQRDLDDESNPFCILTVAEAVGGRLEMAARFG